MNTVSPLPIPVVFLGSDAALAGRLEACYAGITWDREYRMVPRFHARSAREWRAALPASGSGMAFVEITDAGTEGESRLIRAIAAFNPGLQIVLLADDDVDYFQIAADFRIGNVIKKNRFDAAVVHALTIRLLTGNIFGFGPYFPNGFTAGPLYRTFSGHVAIETVIEECYQACRPYVNPGELSSFRIFINELMINTFSYAIEGISPEDRDSKLLRPRPEVDIDERRAIKISLVTDREKVGVSVMDSTGSLSMLRVLQKLRRQSRIGGEKMPPGIWDESGRGMSMVYRYSRFIVNILKGVRTETIFLQYHEQDLNRFESIIITEVNPF
ncbi:MAG TPA: hypothetical protein VJ385_11970 [Fibrobacteria bacterium]|nr:hypothetical protein [Fibrobacteria bacterium]